MNAPELTREKLRGFLDRLNLPSMIDGDGDLYVRLQADNDFDHDVVVFLMLREGNSLGVYGYALDFEIPEGKTLDALVATNNYNARTKVPKAYVRDNTIRLEQWFCLDEEVSDAYICNNCIGLIISLIWKFFVDLNLDTES